MHSILSRRSTRALLTLAVLFVGACAVFDTTVKNPNAVEEGALGDPASASILAIGLTNSLTRAFSSVYGPYSVATDELTWSGSRENWGFLDEGDVSRPDNEYTDAAYPLMSEARWYSNYVIDKLERFEKAGTLRNKVDLARTYIMAGITYLSIAEMYDDFVIASDRTVAGDSVGAAAMVTLFDSASKHLGKAILVATAIGNNEMRSQGLALRARAKVSKAVWKTLKPARTTPANPLINDSEANADAAAALALMAGNYRFQLRPGTGNTGTNNFGSEMNSRQELRAGSEFINPDPTRNNLTPLPGAAGIKLKDPITNAIDPVTAKNIDECCRVSSGTQIPVTVTSAKEMHLILAEAALASGNAAEFRGRINAVRALDALPAWDGVTPSALDMLIHSRRVNLFLQGRRLHDLYRFGLKADRWLPTSVAARKACFFPIARIERQSNVKAQQPATDRAPYCS